MISKAGRSSVFILAAGLLVLPAGPSHAANDTDESAAAGASQEAAAAPVTLHRTVRHVAHQRHDASHQSHRIAAKGSDDKKAADAANADDKAIPAIAPSVANANAQFPPVAPQPAANTVQPAQSNAAEATPDQTTGVKMDNGTALVAADELNDVDRSLHEGDPPVPPADVASNPSPALAAKANDQSSVWDETSLIGKIFIGFGALLTMASAARMFMA